MVPLLTLRDEMRLSKTGRTAGSKTRCHTLIGIDNYNVVLAEGAADVPQGKKFYGNFALLGKTLTEWDGVDEAVARKEMEVRLCEVFGGEPSGMSWKEMDVAFKIPERETDSSGRLTLFRRLKEAGLEGDDDEA